MSTDAADAVPLSSGQGTVEKTSDFGKGEVGRFQRWKAELDTSKRNRKDWQMRAEKVLRRYRDERDAINSSDRLFNILWSNVQVQKPALYSKPPKPEVSRQFDTESDINRVAAMIMERNLEYFVCEHSLYDQVLQACVLDRLLPGQGSAWIRYEANIPGEYAAADPQAPVTNAAEHANKGLTDDQYAAPTEEKICYDYVHWKDFRTSPARTWEEVTWVARRVFLDREAGEERFGEKFKKVPLNYKESEKNNPGSNQPFGPGLSVIAKAAIWEIWDKVGLKVLWLCEDYPEILDEKDDLLKLTGFFPCPKPLLATVTTDSIVPIPDYCMYQDQAQELDQATNRISLLMQALKVIGVYDKTQDALQRLLTEGVDNVMIPVDNWAMFAERGGIKGTVDFFPVDAVGKVLTQLIQDRNVIKQDIYEITGIADIVRGATVASETATAQDLKAKFAGIRINDSQKDIARFCADLMNMSAEVMTNFFQPETLVINADLTQENPDFQFVPGAIALIKNRELVRHRMTVSVDAITEADQQEEKEARVEFLTAMGQFLQQASAAVQEHPELGQMMGHMILWGARGFKVGRDLEGVLEQGIKAIAKAPPQEKPPSPEEVKAKAEADKMAQQMQLEQQKAQVEQQMQAAEMAAKQQERQQELAFKEREMEQKLQFQEREFAMKLQFMQQEHDLKLQQLQQETALKTEVAQIEGAVKMQSAEQDAQLQREAHDQDSAIAADEHAQSMEQAEEEAERKRKESDDA